MLTARPRLEVTPADPLATGRADVTACSVFSLPLTSLDALYPVAIPICAIRVIFSAFSASFAACSLCCLLAPSSISRKALSSKSCKCGRFSRRIVGASLSRPYTPSEDEGRGIRWRGALATEVSILSAPGDSFEDAAGFRSEGAGFFARTGDSCRVDLLLLRPPGCDELRGGMERSGESGCSLSILLDDKGGR